MNITIIDAMMGRGKTTAAINYMNAHRDDRRFIYVTPYLSEVDRVCEACGFVQPRNDLKDEADCGTKLAKLKLLLREKKSVATTHALFYSFDPTVLELVGENEYCLIIDESINIIQHIPMKKDDLDVIIQHLATVQEDGRVTWNNNTYDGVYSNLKFYADKRSLYLFGTSFIRTLSPDLLRSFREVIMMTYMFNGQYQRAYLDFFGFKYKICGVSEDGQSFTDEPDKPKPIDVKSLIHILDDKKFNAIGDDKFALSKSWYDRRSRGHKDTKRLRNNLRLFFMQYKDRGVAKLMWTTFKEDAPKLYGDNNRYSRSFLQLHARATNDYKDRDIVVYLVNRFVDPNISKFFAKNGVTVDSDEFALSEMLQWIWRSAIRNGKPIDIYIPSSRMRKLFIDWLDKVSVEEVVLCDFVTDEVA